MNLGFAVNEDKRNDINVSLSFAKQTDANFCIKTLNGSAHSISNPSNIPTFQKGVELYYQHRIVEDGICGKINAVMSKMMGNLKDPETPFRKYLNKEVFNVSQASLGLIDAIIIGVMLHTNP
jgi:hypothetical protein